MTCGDDRFSASVGQEPAARAAYLVMRRCRASRLSGVPRRVGNSGSVFDPAAFGDPGLEQLRGVGCEGCDSLSAALAEAADVGTGSEVDVADGQGGELACSQTGLAGECQHRLVTPSGPGVLVGCGEQARRSRPR